MERLLDCVGQLLALLELLLLQLGVLLHMFECRLFVNAVFSLLHLVDMIRTRSDLVVAVTTERADTT